MFLAKILDLAVKDHSRGRHLRGESVQRERLMTRLVRCKEGMLRTKKGEQKML